MPVGLYLFVISGVTGESILRLARHTAPYVFAILIVVLALAFVPELPFFLIEC